MRLPLVLLPEAEDELREALRWYEAERAGLGMELLGCIQDCLTRIADAPERNAAWSKEPRYRKLAARRFPYVVFHEVRVESIEVVAIAHASREPGYWRARSASRP